jgi:hypothetical protein
MKMFKIPRRGVWNTPREIRPGDMTTNKSIKIQPQVSGRIQYAPTGKFLAVSKSF